ncbi:zinc finger protein 830 [Trichonephila inaurata madagascariensis]|uniref:Zinc finger protein 830 n=1 Tax=Trichonephila inaurata madagascariensis TaxID=2747483 RepID=A0A8X6WU53_9ARAC|nr:zinc finger protein 830 [Trichonephila inaurata madagascariensis]
MYNSLGQLSCSICNVVVKGSNLWGAHIAGKIHKESLLRQKKVSTNDLKDVVNVGVKRTSEQPEATKKVKSNVEPPVESQPTKTASLLAEYSSSDESDMDVSEETVLSQTQSLSNNGLPSEKETKEVMPTNNVEKLPEGFFDDPVLDAKARNIEYKDPVEEEWERFQKTIAEETNVSKTIIEEDLEVSTLERDIEQIDEQIQQWERVKNLQSLADDVKMKAPKKDGDNNDSSSTDEDLDEDDLLDWRSKGVKKL